MARRGIFLLLLTMLPACSRQEPTPPDMSGRLVDITCGPVEIDFPHVCMLNVSLRPGDQPGTVWSVSDTSIASLTSDGFYTTVHGKRLGTVTVRAQLQHYPQVADSERVDIVPTKLWVWYIKVALPDSVLAMGDTMRATGTVYDQHGRVWASYPRDSVYWWGEGAAASVTTDGLIRGVAPGRVKITAFAHKLFSNVGGTTSVRVVAPQGARERLRW